MQPRCHPAWCWGQQTSINTHRWSPGAPLLGRDHFTDDLWWWAHGRNVLFIFHLLQTCGLFLSVTVDSSEHRESFLRKVTLFMDLQGRVRGGQSQGFSFPSHLHQTSDKSQFVIYERWKWETLKMATTQRNRAEGDADAGDASHCLLLHPNR